MRKEKWLFAYDRVDILSGRRRGRRGHGRVGRVGGRGRVGRGRVVRTQRARRCRCDRAVIRGRRRTGEFIATIIIIIAIINLVGVLFRLIVI